ncbi:MAG: hypothetical protein HY986_26385 [Candidatus Melainabacteria bacterium]|nr:hypothetical protein [Candidatus Melainabacteria bacterium]
MLNCNIFDELSARARELYGEACLQEELEALSAFRLQVMDLSPKEAIEAHFQEDGSLLYCVLRTGGLAFFHLRGQDGTWSCRQIRTGDVYLVLPGEPHHIVNLGNRSLRLLCGFPLKLSAVKIPVEPPNKLMGNIEE